LLRPSFAGLVHAGIIRHFARESISRHEKFVMLTGNSAAPNAASWNERTQRLPFNRAECPLALI
jgi:hypothetical protein